jgi:hypothetical protein
MPGPRRPREIRRPGRRPLSLIVALTALGVLGSACHGHGANPYGGAGAAGSTPGVSLSVDPWAMLASVVLADSAHVAVFQWRPPIGFELIASDPAGGDAAPLPPGEYTLGLSLAAAVREGPADARLDGRVHLVLIASDGPLELGSWDGEPALRGPDGRVVTRRGALAWLVDTVVQAPETTAWALVEQRAARWQATSGRPPAGLGHGQAGPHVPGPRALRPVDRTGGPPPTSQPERRPD